jgi:hypothetical protein
VTRRLRLFHRATPHAALDQARAALLACIFVLAHVLSVSSKLSNCGQQ